MKVSWNRGTPSSPPFIDGLSMKPSNARLGYPPDDGNPSVKSSWYCSSRFRASLSSWGGTKAFSVAPSPWYVGRYPWPWPLWIGKTYGKTHDSIIHWMMYPPYALCVQSLSNKPMSQDWSNCYQTGGDFDSLIIDGAWGSASGTNSLEFMDSFCWRATIAIDYTYSMAMTGHGAAKRCDSGNAATRRQPMEVVHLKSNILIRHLNIKIVQNQQYLPSGYLT